MVVGNNHTEVVGNILVVAVGHILAVAEVVVGYIYLSRKTYLSPITKS
jgi:hypothetical protein